MAVKNLYRFMEKVKRAEQVAKSLDSLVRRAAEVAANEIKERHDEVIQTYIDSFQGERSPSYVVNVAKTDKGYSVEVVGESVLFVEYGTGVSFNTPPAPRPEFMYDIGEYGYGLGNLTSWTYPVTKGGELRLTTFGNPAAVGLSSAVNKVKSEMPRLIKELWNDKH